jgi:hypothetical protein
MRFSSTLMGCAMMALAAGCTAPPWQPTPAPASEPVAKPAPPPTQQQIGAALSELNKAFQRE